ncbi:hypothetical protein PR048_022576 [Dryococelus australis]|uniref:Uncharacterized protein n=1 Tax=Dryococelus australis TaxID=614101 RepID=A0ABQ9H1H0_9NEOP|nr:hypothetical protein PR048_022576 [Dryococelus australis]
MVEESGRNDKKICEKVKRAEGFMRHMRRQNVLCNTLVWTAEGSGRVFKEERWRLDQSENGDVVGKQKNMEKVVLEMNLISSCNLFMMILKNCLSLTEPCSSEPLRWGGNLRLQSAVLARQRGAGSSSVSARTSTRPRGLPTASSSTGRWRMRGCRRAVSERRDWSRTDSVTGQSSGRCRSMAMEAWEPPTPALAPSSRDSRLPERVLRPERRPRGGDLQPQPLHPGLSMDSAWRCSSRGLRKAHDGLSDVLTGRTGLRIQVSFLTSKIPFDNIGEKLVEVTRFHGSCDVITAMLCRKLAGFLGEFPFPPRFHSGAAQLWVPARTSACGRGRWLRRWRAVAEVGRRGALAQGGRYDVVRGRPQAPVRARRLGGWLSVLQRSRELHEGGGERAAANGVAAAGRRSDLGGGSGGGVLVEPQPRGVPPRLAARRAPGAAPADR